MTTLFHTLLTAYVLPGLILAFGLCFFFVVVPVRRGLGGYRMARRMMGCAYLVCFAALVAEAVTQKLTSPTTSQQILMVAIAILQAFFFTYALVTLIDVRFFTWRRFWRETVVVTLPVMAALVVAFAFNGQYADAAFWLLALFYVGKLLGYVFLFRRHYRGYELRMADYFSDDERQRLSWVKRSFYASLAMGVLALFYTLFSAIPSASAVLSLLFTLVMTAYYAVFAIRFVNYAFSFQQIEVAMLDEPLLVAQDTENSPSAVSPVSPSLKGNTEEHSLIDRLDSLMTEKRLYANPNLTIEELAVLVGESHRAVSAAINSCRKTNFKAWVNAYRIGEAQRLIGEGFLENYTTDALAKAVGFANRISFYRVFKKATGHSPSEF